MALSYEFSIGSVRARENLMLNSADVEQMAALKSSDALCRFLNDKGYGDGKNVEQVLENHSGNLWKYIKNLAPDFSIFNPFLYQNDVHNVKAVLKGTMTSRDYTTLLVTPNTISTHTIVKAVENRKFSLFPEWLAKSADKAYEVIAHALDARLCDAYLDKAAMAQMLESSANSGSAFLSEYFKTLVFYNDVKISIRSAKTGADKSFYEAALCDVCGFSTGKITDAALKDFNTLLDTLEKIGSYGCDKAIDAYKSSPSDFEKFVDNKLMSLSKEYCKRAGEGFEPLVGFLVGSMAEQKAIHIIDCGIRTDSGADKIKERLREIYG